MAEVSKSLALARTAREEGNTEDAKKFYEAVREEEPDNAEAKFFYSYYSLHEGTNGEIPKRFSVLCTGMKSAMKMVKDSAASQEERYSLLRTMFDAFVPETWSNVRYMNKKNHETKIGDSYVTVFETSDIKSVEREGMATCRDIGEDVLTLFGTNSETEKLAAQAWKEYVSLSQKWYWDAVKGDAEKYAAKIKGIEPEYVMPKKGSCISFG